MHKNVVLKNQAARHFTAFKEEKKKYTNLPSVKLRFSIACRNRATPVIRWVSIRRRNKNK